LQPNRRKCTKFWILMIFTDGCDCSATKLMKAILFYAVRAVLARVTVEKIVSDLTGPLISPPVRN
jgi:hypothetical protein